MFCCYLTTLFTYIVIGHTFNSLCFGKVYTTSLLSWLCRGNCIMFATAGVKQIDWWCVVSMFFFDKLIKKFKIIELSSL